MTHEIVEVSDFTIVGGDRVEGLTPDILAQLHSIGRHYGFPHPDGYDIQYFGPESLGIEPGIAILTGVSEWNPMLSVGTNSIIDNPFSIQTATGEVQWDRNLSVDEALKQVEKINIRAAELGIYDPVTKDRVEAHAPIPEPTEKIKVEVAFVEPDARIVVTAPNALAALEQFDHPEKLTISESSDSNGFIITRRT